MKRTQSPLKTTTEETAEEEMVDVVMAENDGRGDDDEDPDRLYCYCQRAYQSGDFLIEVCTDFSFWFVFGVYLNTIYSVMDVRTGSMETV
jgi:hypothetical protein